MPTTERSVLDGHDHTACAAKVRKDSYRAPNGYDSDGRMTFKEVKDESSKECQYDRRRVDPACRVERCPRIGD